MRLVDTHCHPHFDDFLPDSSGMLLRAKSAGVTKILAVGTGVEDSRRAVEFAQNNDGVWAAAGIHPHEAEEFLSEEGNKQQFLTILNKSSIVAVGEIGLDYYKDLAPRKAQLELLCFQLDATKDLGLPYIFHVRDAWDDFLEVYDQYGSLPGVVHSFTSGPKILKKVLERGFYVGLNGIITFTRDEPQLAAAKAVPLDRLMLETDAPFLTPAPNRDEICEPRHVRTVAEFLAELRGESLEEIAAATTANAEKLFGLSDG